MDYDQAYILITDFQDHLETPHSSFNLEIKPVHQSGSVYSKLLPEHFILNLLEAKSQKQPVESNWLRLKYHLALDAKLTKDKLNSEMVSVSSGAEKYRYICWEAKATVHGNLICLYHFSELIWCLVMTSEAVMTDLISLLPKAKRTLKVKLAYNTVMPCQLCLQMLCH